MTGIDCLIYWLEQIQEGETPSIPYNLHDLVRCLHNGLGTGEALEQLKYLKTYQDDTTTSRLNIEKEKT